MIRTYGRDYAPDPRDRKFRFPRITTTRQRRFWRDTWWRGDQGSEPACVGFAWAHWLAAAPIRQLVDPVGIYTLAQHLDEWEGTDYDGTSVRAGAKVLSLLGMIGEYRWAWRVSDVIPVVLELGPVVIGVDWYEGMEESDDKGFLNLTGDVLGGHAVLIRGVDRKKERLQILNSWEPNWGDEGHAWLRFADLDKLLKADGEACLAVERKPR